MKQIVVYLPNFIFGIQTGCILVLVFFLIFKSAPAAEADADSTLPSAPWLKCPLYVMEYHVWYRSPFGMGPQPGYVHWGQTEHIDSTLPDDQNIRDMGAVGYPLLGLYNSENRDVIRWQLRCAHRAGIDGLFVQLFPDRVTGTYLGGSKVFATMLKVAAEEHIPIACHDEVMFRSKWKAQEPDVTATRIGKFIQQFGADPAYLKINCEPVYAFQYWDKFIPPDQMAACLDDAEHIAGTPIHFLILGGSDPLYKRKSPSSFVYMGNSFFIQPFTPSASKQPSNIPSMTNWIRLGVESRGIGFLQMSYPQDKFGLWGYGGFNNYPQNLVLHENPSSFYRENGDVLAQVLTAYSQVNPDFILLSSWNDWMENTALEPGYRYDGSDKKPARDPYRYCRILAKAKGLMFDPPPLPPKEAIDPLRWQSLYGIDATPPLLKSCTFSHEGNQVESTWTDSGSGVSESVLSETGDAWVDFRSNTSKNLSWTIGSGTASAAGFLLTSNNPLNLNLGNVPLQGSLADWYLALQFQGQQRGTITINYTANPPGIDYREFDSVTFPAAALMTVDGSGASRLEVSLLRAADFAPEKKPNITLSLSSNGNPSDSNSGVYLRRLDLFHSLDSSIKGTLLGQGMTPNMETHFQYQLADKPQFVFVFARDAKGNWSAPQAVTSNP